MLNCTTGEITCAEVISLRGIGDAGVGAALEALNVDLTAAQKLRHPNLLRYEALLPQTTENKSSSPSSSSSSSSCSYSYSSAAAATAFLFVDGVLGETLEQIVSACAHHASGEGIPESTVQLYAKQLLAGLSYMHRMGTYHGSVCCANACVTRTGEVKLTNYWASPQTLSVFRKSLPESVRLHSLQARQTWDLQCLGYLVLCLLLGGGARTADECSGSPDLGPPSPRLLRALASSLPESIPSEALSFIATCICGSGSTSSSASSASISGGVVLPPSILSVDALLRHPFIAPIQESLPQAHRLRTVWHPLRKRHQPELPQRDQNRPVSSSLASASVGGGKGASFTTSSNCAPITKKSAGGGNRKGGTKSLTVHQASFLRNLESISPSSRISNNDQWQS